MDRNKRKHELMKKMMTEFLNGDRRTAPKGMFLNMDELFNEKNNPTKNIFSQHNREPDKVETQKENGIVYEKKIWYNENGGATVQTSMYNENGGEMNPPFEMDMGGGMTMDDVFEQMMGMSASEFDGDIDEEDVFRQMMGDEPQPKTLKDKLDEAIENEDYELAAKIRDKMKESEEKG